MQSIEMYGARYYAAGEHAIEASPVAALYSYRLHVGRHELDIVAGDCAFIFGTKRHGRDLGVHRVRGPVQIESDDFACVIRGYAPDNCSRSLTNGMLLPYVNGCATKQLFPPDRPGDPTWQQLIIPPYSKEQAHHIHSTARVVYVLAGEGESIVGMEGKEHRNPLTPGMVCVLDPMCPHHFETKGNPLNVLPVHVWSSTPAEWNHPMFHGTHLTDQGMS